MTVADPGWPIIPRPVTPTDFVTHLLAYSTAPFGIIDPVLTLSLTDWLRYCYDDDTGKWWFILTQFDSHYCSVMCVTYGIDRLLAVVLYSWLIDSTVVMMIVFYYGYCTIYYSTQLIVNILMLLLLFILRLTHCSTLLIDDTLMMVYWFLTKTVMMTDEGQLLLFGDTLLMTLIQYWLLLTHYRDLHWNWLLFRPALLTCIVLVILLVVIFLLLIFPITTVGWPGDSVDDSTCYWHC